MSIFCQIQFGIKCAVLNAELPQNSRLHILEVGVKTSVRHRADTKTAVDLFICCFFFEPFWFNFDFLWVAHN